ncbi:MAG TPA: hypothetical protein VEK07_06720 [Polyangiaceae bacterium]|nr:hypothetical protein [Polyangiaceae bacterium]
MKMHLATCASLEPSRGIQRPVRDRFGRACMAWTFGLGTALAPAPSAPGAGTALGRPAAASPCEVTEVEYAAVGRLRVKDTLFGAGDGVFPIGPGTIVLRFGAAGATGGRRVQLRVYTMKQHVVVISTALFWTTTVTSDSDTRLTAPAGGVLTGHTLRWQGPPAAMRSDGVIVCDGSLCGLFGAPSKGNSPLHMGPNAVSLEPFEFDADMTTFTMRYTFVSETDSPKQRSYVALAGREVRRTCQTELASIQ